MGKYNEFLYDGDVYQGENWAVIINWSRDGALMTNDAGRIRSMKIRRGRQEGIGFSGYEYSDPGSASIVLNNADEQLSLFNPDSLLVGYLLPNREITIQYTAGGVTYPVLRGVVRNIRPFRKDKTAAVDAVDGIDYLQSATTGGSGVSTDHPVSTAINDILQAVSYPYSDVSGWFFPMTFPVALGSAQIIDNGDSIDDFYLTADTSAWDQITDIAQAFAGEPYVLADGTFAYRARAYINTPVLTLTDADVTQDSEIQQPWGEVRNTVQVSVLPYGGSESWVTAEDAASQTNFGVRSLVIQSPWVQNATVGQNGADYAVALYADARKSVWVKIRNRPEIGYALDLFDQVTLALDALYIAGDYQVTYIEHDIGPVDHLTTWRLEPTPQAIASFWVFPATFNTQLGW